MRNFIALFECLFVCRMRMRTLHDNGINVSHFGECSKLLQF